MCAVQVLYSRIAVPDTHAFLKGPAASCKSSEQSMLISRTRSCVCCRLILPEIQLLDLQSLDCSTSICWLQGSLSLPCAESPRDRHRPWILKENQTATAITSAGDTFIEVSSPLSPQAYANSLPRTDLISILRDRYQQGPLQVPTQVVPGKFT